MSALPGWARAAGGLPGADVVEAGVAQLQRGELGVEALLLASAAPHLRLLGVELPATAGVDGPELMLYRQIAACHSDAEAHAAYNAWRQRLDRFLRAAAGVVRREREAESVRCR